MRIFKWVKKTYLGLVLLFMYAPIVVLMVYSFNASKSRGRFGGFSLQWYQSLFSANTSIGRTIMGGVYNTLAVALLASLFATIIGTAAAIGINAMKSRPRKVILTLTNIPVMIPDIVAGISLMILYLFVFNVFKAGSKGFITLLLAHITFNIPYVILSVLPKYRQLDKNMYEAALDLGAPPLTAFWKIVFPQLLPGIMTGALFAFTLSLDDFVISFFTKGVGSPNLSVIIYSYAAKKGIPQEINAVSTIMFTVVLLLLFIVNTRDSRDAKKKRRKGKRV